MTSPREKNATSREAQATRRGQQFARLALRLDRRSSALAAVRLALALAAFSLVVVGGVAPERRAAALAAAAVLSVAFAGVAVIHGRTTRRQGLVRALEDGAQREVLRARGQFKALPATGAGLATNAALDGDLSLTGLSSLFQLVSRAATPQGEAALARALSLGRAEADLAARQSAVAELRPCRAACGRLQALGRTRSLPPQGGRPLAELLVAPRGGLLHEERPWLRPAAWITCGASAGLGLAWAVTDRFGAAFGATLALQFMLFALHANRLIQEYHALLPHEEAVLSFARLARFVEARRPKAELLLHLREVLTGAGGEQPTASRCLGDLARRLGSLSLRHGSIHPVINALVPWDIEHVHRLTRWKREALPRLSAWTDALAEMEALASLAAHAAGMDDDGGPWCFPDVTEGGPFLAASDLAHPLLPPARAVANDVRIEGPGSLVLLTGSNMAGKSTLLRAVGCNAALAFAGGAVAARSFRLQPCRLETSVHVSDALAEGVSQFHAEVLRLKAILDAVADGDRGGLPTLFLVDEILRGTNTRERLIAARSVIRQLAGSRSAGFVTSHDLSLAELEGVVPGLVNAHFREHVEEGRMTFDYRLREGPVTTTNALAVLRLAGIPVDDERS